MKSFQVFLTLIGFLFGLVLSNQTAVAVEAVASVKNIRGPVDVQRKEKRIAARAGLILHDQDLVVTYDKSRITLIFRDGSIIRLFPNTRFLIEKSEEAPSGPRRFLHDFRLKLGSFWGKFTRNRQQTVIKAPTATVGIKGTTIAMKERNNTLGLRLSTGKVQISNQSESVELSAGQYVKDITKTGTIKDKIGNLPFQILINPDQSTVTVPNPGEKEELYFTLQLVNLKTNENVEKTGPVYLSITAENIVFDQDVQLNSRGYARAKATISAPKSMTYAMDTVEIFALMDGEEFLDVKSGSTVLTLEYPKGLKRKLKIDAKSGDVKQ